ncbi:serine/threonine-protein kinase [Natronoglycomyces albus]|uniref:mitogen-activated protein kinase kinase n=1 Tax=Natronoglycomyces albus TaxID=2811108 RepID=A0A895XR84_9ACTN|nr:serine/threonine-protein kinase [Natronoglycomyces albus]QSB05869.1 serine/threonine protein kinase [Natronoglycomyces albus]
MNSVSSYPTAARASVPQGNRRPDQPTAAPGGPAVAVQSPPRHSGTHAPQQPPSPHGAPHHPPTPQHPSVDLDPAHLLKGLEDLTGYAEIARGAYSIVYSAQAPNGRTVAVKIDRRPLADEGQRRRFQQEVTSAGRVSKHPCVVQMYSAGFTSQGHPYVVMEHCRESLSDYLAREHKLYPEDVRQIGVRIATALAAAHAEGIIHRDVKPANILINQQGQVVLADFGLSALSPQPAPGQPISIMATPAYAPLEVFQLQEIGPAADVYSLAATLYALLSGAPPRFPLEATRPLDINEVASLLHEPVDNLPGVSLLMVEMIRTALINNAQGRPTAEAFAEYLDSIPEESTGVFQAIDDSMVAPEPSPPREGTFGAFSAPPDEDVEAPVAARAAVEAALGSQGMNYDAPYGYEQPQGYDQPQNYDPSFSEALGRMPENVSSPNTAPTAQTGVVHPPIPVPEPVNDQGFDQWDDLSGESLPGRSFPQTEKPYESSLEHSPVRPSHDEGLYRHEAASFSPPAQRSPAKSAPLVDETQRWDNFASLDEAEAPAPETSAGPNTGMTRRERRLASGESDSSMGQLIGIGSVSLIVVIALVFGAIKLFGGNGSAPLEDNANDGVYVPECTLDMAGVACVAEPVCFNGAPGDDIAELACDNPHTWEAYAIGQLPEEVSEPTHQEALQSSIVTDACVDGHREDGPLQEFVGADRVSWETDVHLPTAEAFANGDRTFMCIARQANGETEMGHRFARG